MARQFKPVRFFVLMALFAFVLCGVTAFYTHRAEHGRSPDERAGYWVGKKVGEESAPDAKLPTAAALNTMAQDYFQRQGSVVTKAIGILDSSADTRTALTASTQSLSPEERAKPAPRGGLHPYFSSACPPYTP
jgi:hypothetical protein